MINIEDDILLIDKPAQMSSFGVVARVRSRLSRMAGKKIKVGHAGTLDPFATGLLIILIGKACKRADQFLKLDKTYEVTAILGKKSTTGDPEGEIIETSNSIPKKEKIEEVLESFKGEQMQTPPMYSAIKVDGQRAYKLARKGGEVKIEPRKVRINSIDLDLYEYPVLRFTANVGSGTYIRSLVEDIGEELKVGAYTKELRRTSIDNYAIEDAEELKDGEYHPIS